MTTNFTIEQLYLSYGYMRLPKTAERKGMTKTTALLGTFLSNMAYYGYVPSAVVMKSLIHASPAQLKALWEPLEVALRSNSGAARDIGKYIVYKNFPTEVLEMSQAEYWLKQILMYVGLPNEWFTQDEAPRDALFEEVTMKVLHAVAEDTPFLIFQSLLAMPTRWTDSQLEHAMFLMGLFGKNLSIAVNLDTVGFKENGIRAILFARHNGLNVNVTITTATDAMRLAAGMSGGDISLRTPIKFKKFSRAERRELLSYMDSAPNLEQDIAARKGLFKQLFMVLHPGDYNFANVKTVYNKLYNNQVKSFASQIVNSDPIDLKLLSTRPGEFLRRFHSVYSSLGNAVVVAFSEIAPKLSTHQLVKFRKYVQTINNRKTLMYPPRGNWNKVKVEPNKKTPIAYDDVMAINTIIDSILRVRMGELFPNGIALDASVGRVKLQTNDQKLAPYGRGTSFPIPENITFIRAASYWENSDSAHSGVNLWMDNGFNFYQDGWSPAGSICWNDTGFSNAAVFSGDPTNSKTSDGKACQLIDLYIDKLKDIGVRYAVWNILSYNAVPFDDVEDAFASLQWGECAISGKVYEPSRAQMEFPITGAGLTKYIAYIDLHTRELVYMDANFVGSTQSASRNLYHVADLMPAYVEYLNSLPSVHDLFESAPAGSTPVTFSDANMEIKGGKAYVFRPENQDNDFTKLNLVSVL